MATVTVTATQVRPGSFALTRHFTAGEALTVGAVVQVVGDGEVELANATTAAGVNGLIGVVVAGDKASAAGTIASGEGCTVVIQGEVHLGSTTNMDETLTVWVGTSDGIMVDVAPQYYRAVGTPISATTLFVNPVATPAGS